MPEEKPKIPILTKDAICEVSVTYGESASIVQSIFAIAKNFTPEQVQIFKDALEKREKIEDPNMLIYLHLDRLYKKILTYAKENNMIEYVDLESSIDPLSRS